LRCTMANQWHGPPPTAEQLRIKERPLGPFQNPNINNTQLKDILKLNYNKPFKTALWWYHRKYFQSGSAGFFIHTFIVVSGIGMYLHWKRHGHTTQYEHH